MRDREGAIDESGGRRRKIMESEEEPDVGVKKHAISIVRVWIVVGEGV